MAASGKFGVDQRVINRDFEPPTFGGHKLDFNDRKGVAFEQRFRQTDGLGGVVSQYAEFNADPHSVAPS